MSTSKLRSPGRLSAALAGVAALTIGLGGCTQPAATPSSEPTATETPARSESPEPTPTPDADAAALLEDTAWGGTDSDGNVWHFDLESGGAIVFAYNGYGSWPDGGGRWSVDGDVVDLGFGFDDAPIDMVGLFDGLENPMLAEGTRPQGTFTITLTREDFQAWRDDIGQ